MSLWNKINDLKSIKEKLKPKPWLAIITVIICVVVDAVQIVLDYFAIGFILNPIIDFAFESVLLIGLWLSGVRFMTKNRLLAILGSLVGKEAHVQDVTFIPLFAAEACTLIGSAWMETLEKEVTNKAIVQAVAKPEPSQNVTPLPNRMDDIRRAV